MRFWGAKMPFGNHEAIPRLAQKKKKASRAFAPLAFFVRQAAGLSRLKKKKQAGSLLYMIGPI
jgi:hypothetical protein